MVTLTRCLTAVTKFLCGAGAVVGLSLDGGGQESPDGMWGTRKATSKAPL